MFQSARKKGLLIVCSNERTQKHGDFLSRLISAGGDEVDVTVWIEKVYENNRIQMSTGRQKILFLGYGNASKNMIDTTPSGFDLCHMHYGSMGNQAVAYVGKGRLHGSEYDQVREIYEIYRARLEESDVKLDEMEHKKRRNRRIDILDVAIPVKGLIKVVQTEKDKEKVYRKRREQQYMCLLLIWYMDAYREFMGLDDE